MKCKICELRKARRYCPGVGGDICPLCCGTEREVTIDCPRDCPYLMEARVHERFSPPDLNNLLYPELRLDTKFLDEHEYLMAFMGIALYDAAQANPRAVDADMREALDALAKTYHTLINGLVYESRPVNSFAAGIFDHIQDAIAKFRKEPIGNGLRDAELLATIVFFLRFAFDRNNGRPKGRALLDLVASQFQGIRGAAPEATRLIEL